MSHIDGQQVELFIKYESVVNLDDQSTFKREVMPKVLHFVTVLMKKTLYENKFN